MLYWYETVPSCRPAEWRLIRPRATDPYRNAWPLNWCRRKAYTFNLVMFAVITERFPAPESRYDVERLVKSLAENPWSDLLSKPAILYFSLSANAHSEHQPSVGKLVDRRSLSCYLPG